jgi:hypothetical protein
VVVVSDDRFAGVDWASEEHAVCLVDERGRIVEGHRYRHDERGIRALCARLVRLRVAMVALERPDGLLFERLLDAGLTVVAVHPKEVKAMRPRYSVADGESDSFDSFVLAELARTDSHRSRVLVPEGDRTKALRAMTRARDSLVRTRVGLADQLRDELGCFWPGAAAVFWSVDSQIALAFPRRYPTPSTPQAWVSSAFTRSWSATATPAASPPASCSHDDQGVEAMTVAGVPGLTHDRDDLIDRRPVRRVALAPIARRPTGTKPGRGRRRATPAGSIQQQLN